MQESQESTNVYQYRVNAQNEIVEVNEAWEAFALYNKGNGLQRDQIIGRSVLDSIPDPTVRKHYERLLEAVRGSGGSARIPFRCDAPDERRVMELEIQADQEGGIRLSGRLLNREYRPPVALLDQALARNDQTVQLCSICLRMQCGDGSWQEIEQALDDPHDRRQECLPAIVYGICSDCEQCMERETRKLASGRTARGKGTNHADQAGP